jgi:hypothetical protein
MRRFLHFIGYATPLGEVEPLTMSPVTHRTEVRRPRYSRRSVLAHGLWACLAASPLGSSALGHRVTCFLEVFGCKAVDLFFYR